MWHMSVGNADINVTLGPMHLVVDHLAQPLLRRTWPRGAMWLASSPSMVSFHSRDGLCLPDSHLELRKPRAPLLPPGLLLLASLRHYFRSCSWRNPASMLKMR
jgi:hypothetical protein